MKGKHSLKFGANISRVRLNFNFDYFTNGSYDFTFGDYTGYELADFVAGFLITISSSPKPYTVFDRLSGTSSARTPGKSVGDLTLDLGLRYEYNSPQIDPHNNILGFYPGQQSTVFPDAPPGILYPGDPGTPNRGLVYPDRNNFAPRFGFAWDMLGTGKLVMRGGFGIFYDIEDGALNLQFGGQPPFGDGQQPVPVQWRLAGRSPWTDPLPLADQNPYPFAQKGGVGTFSFPRCRSRTSSIRPPHALFRELQFRLPVSTDA